VAEKKAEEVAGKKRSKSSSRKGGRKAGRNNAAEVSIGKSIPPGENWNYTDLDLARFFRAALLLLPRAGASFFDKCAIVLFRRASFGCLLNVRFAAAGVFLCSYPHRTGQSSKALV